MTLDHAGYYFWPEIGAFRVVGRAAMPIFCFLLGYNGEDRFRWTLLVAALLITAADWAMSGPKPLDILWGLLLARLYLRMTDADALRRQAWVCSVVLLVFWLPGELVLGYGTGILLWALAGRAHRTLPGSATAWLYLGAAWISSVFSVGFMFRPSPPTAIAAMALVSAVALLLRRVNFQPWHAPWPRFWQGWSRHALAYYVAHRLAFMALSAALGVAHPA